MKPLNTLVVVLLTWGIMGCSSATPTTRYYLLSDPYGAAADTGGAAAPASCGVRLGRVAIAPYLQRTHIIVQDGANELVPALQHRWSEPLEAGIERLLVGCLQGNPEVAEPVDVTVEHLHGDTDGSVVLQARWSARGHGGRFSTVQRQRSAGYDALVTTQRALVLQLCADINAATETCDAKTP